MSQWIWIWKSQTWRGYIFCIFGHLQAKLCNFANFKMLFRAVVKDFVLLAVPSSVKLCKTKRFMPEKTRFMCVFDRYCTFVQWRPWQPTSYIVVTVAAFA